MEAEQGPLRARRERPVKVYDFLRPDKFSKEQIQTIAIIHETYARQLTAVLASLLRCGAHVRVTAVDQLTYEEFIRSLPSPTTIAVFSMGPALKGSAVVEIDPGITSAMLDRLFGGGAVPSATNRELTDIEVATLEGALPRMLEPFTTAWAAVADVRPGLMGVETKPLFAQVVPPREMIVLASLACSVGAGQGMINVALPFLTIEPIIPRLSPQTLWAPRATEGKPNAAAPGLPVSVEVSYEGERLTLAALSQLRKGTRVRVPRFAEGKALLSAGGTPVFNLQAERPRRGRPRYRFQETGGPDLAQLLGASRPRVAESGPVQEALREAAQGINASLQDLRTRVDDVARLQEALSDRLAFPAEEPVRGSAGASDRRRPFGFLTLSYCEVLGTFLGQEHPQLVALVLSHLEPGLAACVLERIPEAMRPDVAARVCTIARTAPEVVREVERILEKKLTSLSSDDVIPAGGVGAVVEILNVAPRGVEKQVVESLEETNAALAEEIKKRMFVFEDIVLLDKATVALVLKAAEEDDIVLSLKAAPQEVREFVWQCLPREAATALQARLEKSGRVRLIDVDAAQQRIVTVIRAMEEEGKIIVGREGEVVG